MRILLIEDEKRTAAFLAKGLREAGFDVAIATDGEVGFNLARGSKFNLLIVDIMILKRDGWTVVKQFREAGAQMPVIFLTPRNGGRHRVKGLELGADDYVVKPFAIPELLARVSSLLRRSPVQRGELRTEELEIDTRHHHATRGGLPLNLTPKEFLLLAI